MNFGGILTSDSGVVSGAAGSTPGGLVGEEPSSDVAMLKRWREARQASPPVPFLWRRTEIRRDPGAVSKFNAGICDP